MFCPGGKNTGHHSKSLLTVPNNLLPGVHDAYGLSLDRACKQPQTFSPVCQVTLARYWRIPPGVLPTARARWLLNIAIPTLRHYDAAGHHGAACLPPATAKSHLSSWVPNALIHEGLEVMRHWGFTYKTNLVWYKVRQDGGPDRRGVGFYFRNVTELVLVRTRGTLRTLAPGRQENIIVSRKRQHSETRCTV